MSREKIKTVQYSTFNNLSKMKRQIMSNACKTIIFVFEINIKKWQSKLLVNEGKRAVTLNVYKTVDNFVSVWKWRGNFSTWLYRGYQDSTELFMMALVNVTISYRLHVYSVKMILTLVSLQIDRYKIGFQSSNRNFSRARARVCVRVRTRNRNFWKHCNNNFYHFLWAYFFVYEIFQF